MAVFYNKMPCKGLGWASEAMENTLALGFRQKDAWNNDGYDVDICLLDEDGEEQQIASKCKHVVSPDGIETHRDFSSRKLIYLLTERCCLYVLPNYFLILSFRNRLLISLKE